MSVSPEKQKDLFNTLDGEKSVGVFLYPKTALTQADQISALEGTITHLTSLRDLVEETKIKGGAAPKITRLLIWLARFESGLETEKRKLLEISRPFPNSMPDSMQPSDAR